MRHYIYTILLLFFVTTLFGQSSGVLPEKMSYQAVVRNATNELITNQEIGVRVSVLKDTPEGPAVYTETQKIVTNANGLLSLMIGDGISQDDFSSIPWNSSKLFVKTEFDLTGGSNYSISGVSQMLTVPYAFHAKTAESVQNLNLTGEEEAFANWDKNQSDDFDGNFLNLENIPADLADGDDVLSEEEVVNYAINNNFLQEVPDNSINGEMIAMGEDQKGDMLYYDGSNYKRLPKGEANQVLLIENEVPKWKTVDGVSNNVQTTYTYWSHIVWLYNTEILVSPAGDDRVQFSFEGFKSNPDNVMIAPKPGKLKRITLVMNETLEDVSNTLGVTEVSFHPDFVEDPVATATLDLSTFGETYIIEYDNAFFDTGDELIVRFSNPDNAKEFVNLAIAFEWEFYDTPLPEK